jgi:hypothetical protein
VKNICELYTPSDLGGCATACDYWERKAYELEQQVFDLQNEVAAHKASRWEPADGIWRVSPSEHGRTITLVAPLYAPEDEAIVRAMLQEHEDVATRAIRDVYDRNKFCPVMLAHEDHDGSCGIWPSAATIWAAIRDAIAARLEGRS